MEWKKPLVIGSDLVERDLGDEIVVMTADGKEIHSFVKTALWIWNKIKEQIIPDDIISQLMLEYEVEENNARNDFVKFIESLKEKDILN